MALISIPNEWAPRPYQIPLWNAFIKDNCRRGVVVAHRRYGKDSVAINIMATKMVQEPGLYYYMAPTQKHARKIIWDNIGKDGKRIVSQAFPEEIRLSVNDQEMRIVIRSADGGESIFQVVGSDNYDSIVGSNPMGIVFSEWALADKPEAWDYFRPILAENGGWALFISTPRAMNHYYQLYRMALTNASWFCLLQTVDDTTVLTADQVQAERDAGMDEMRVRQEFYCEFLAATEAQVFSGELLMEAQENRSLPNPADLKAPLIIGVDVARFGNDRTVIATRHGRDFRSIPPIVIEKQDIVQVAQAVARHANQIKPDAIAIDITGLGAGVLDVLRREIRMRAAGIHFSQKAKDRDHYANIRTEMYFLMREWMEEEGSCLWNDRGLREEMAAIEFEYDNDGRYRLEPKEKAKKRLGVSPDLADAYALTFTVRPPRRDVWHLTGNNQRNTQAVIGW